MREQFNMLVWVQVYNTIELNFDSQTQVLVLIYQDSKRNGSHLIQKISIGDFKQDFKKGKPKSQSSDHKRNFILKLLMECRFQTLNNTICLLLITCRNKQENKDEDNVIDHSIIRKGYSNDYSTTLSIRGKVSTTLIKLFKDLTNMLAPLQQWLYYSLLYKYMNNWRIITNFYHFTSANTLSNSEVH